MKILNIFLLLLNSKAQATDEWPLVSTDHRGNLTAQGTYPWCKALNMYSRTFFLSFWLRQELLTLWCAISGKGMAASFWDFHSAHTTVALNCNNIINATRVKGWYLLLSQAGWHWGGENWRREHQSWRFEHNHQSTISLHICLWYVESFYDFLSLSRAHLIFGL